METKIIQKIQNNTRSLTLLKHNDFYEVSLRDGIVTCQYWKFERLIEALNKLNELADEFYDEFCELKKTAKHQEEVIDSLADRLRARDELIAIYVKRFGVIEDE